MTRFPNLQQLTYYFIGTAQKQKIKSKRNKNKKKNLKLKDISICLPEKLLITNSHLIF